MHLLQHISTDVAATEDAAAAAEKEMIDAAPKGTSGATAAADDETLK